jgi:hypothetical protein
MTENSFLETIGGRPGDSHSKPTRVSELYVLTHFLIICTKLEAPVSMT